MANINKIVKIHKFGKHVLLNVLQSIDGYLANKVRFLFIYLLRNEVLLEHSVPVPICWPYTKRLFKPFYCRRQKTDDV